MRSISVQYNAGQSFSSCSVSYNQQFAATGCGSHISVLSINPTEPVKSHVNIQLKASTILKIFRQIKILLKLILVY